MFSHDPRFEVCDRGPHGGSLLRSLVDFSAGSPMVAFTPTAVHERPARMTLQVSERAHIECDDGSLEGFFPDEARDENITSGRVGLRVTVDGDGRITTARASADPGHGFARAAERALLSGSCTARPARNREGQAVSSTVTFTINFEITS